MTSYGSKVSVVCTVEHQVFCCCCFFFFVVVVVCLFVCLFFVVLRNPDDIVTCI